MNTNKTVVTPEQVAETGAMIDLFHVVPEYAFVRGDNMIPLIEMYKQGFIVCTGGGVLVEEIPAWVYAQIRLKLGNNAIEFNQTFYKNFKQVEDMTVEERIADQIRHYFSTYGLEMFGIQAQPYLPYADLGFDEAEAAAFGNKKLIVVRIANGKMIHELTTDFAKNTKSPSLRFVNDFKLLTPYCDAKIDEVKSFELQVILCDARHEVPSTPSSFLRYLIYKTTGATLLIKNKNTILTIKRMGQYKQYQEMVKDIFGHANENALASVFYRYKPLFLAYKGYGSNVASIINRIRRKAVKYHAPLSPVCLQNWISLYISGEHDEEVAQLLTKADNRELVKLANVLAMRLSAQNGVTPIAYNIRNGKAFIAPPKDEIRNLDKEQMLYNALQEVTEELYVRLESCYGEDTVFIIPDYIDYALPTTEKQFVGNYPCGTKVIAPKDTTFAAGIHWFDQGGRTDIDLHMMGLDGTHYGWNSSYRSGADSEERVTYSGDMTAAPKPNGAAEAFRFNPSKKDFALSVNLYSGVNNAKFKFFIADQDFKEQGRNLIYNPEKALIPAIPMEFVGDGCNGMNLGAFLDGNFRFWNATMTQGIVPTGHYQDYIAAAKNRINSMWMVREFLEGLDVTVVSSLDELKNIKEFDEYDEQQFQDYLNEAHIIDLSPEALTATTMMKFIDGQL